MARQGHPLLGLRWLCALLAASVLCSCARKPEAVPRMVERPDWGRHFQAQGVEGTLVLLGEARAPTQGPMLAYTPQRAATGYLPASTFKIVNALIALDTGVVAGPDELFPWDGTTRDVAAWNRDLTLRQAFAASAVPVYQQIARRIGPQRMAWHVEALGYGNGDISGEAPDRFWLSGNLRVSAVEQVEFLRKLYHGQLPFTAQAMETVKDMMVVERGPNWTLRAKTGWAVKDTPGIGWWVGWLETGGTAGMGSSVWFFALNVDIERPEQLAARQVVVKAVLKDMGLL